MTTIKNLPVGPIRDESQVSSSSESPGPRVKAKRDVEFRRDTSESRRLYEQTRLKVESERAEKLAELKAAIKNGTYRPNLGVVAERIALEVSHRGN